MIQERLSSWNPYDDTTPVVTLNSVPTRRLGNPSATTSDPALSAVAETVGNAFQLLLQQIVNTAKSRIPSWPTIVPVRVPPLPDSRTVTVRAPLMTCSLVSIHALPFPSTRYIQPVPDARMVRISTTLSRANSVILAALNACGVGVGDGVGDGVLVGVGVGVGVGNGVGVAVAVGVGVGIGVGVYVGVGVGIGVGV